MSSRETPPQRSCAARCLPIDAMTKTELRKLLKEKRASIPEEKKKETDAAIVKEILASAIYQNADTLLLFAPMTGEINLLPLVRAARRDGKAVGFPRCNTEENTMDFFELRPEDRLTEGTYRIPEPPKDAPRCSFTERTLCLLPALTFDPFGNRLGYGKGYYDRFLAGFPGITAGVVARQMMVKKVPVEAHDLPVQMLFTEAGRLDCRPLPAPDTTAPEANKSLASASSNQTKTPQKLLTRLKKCLPNKKLFQKLSFSGSRAKPLHTPPLLVLCVFVLLLLSRLIDRFLTTRENEYVVVILLQILIFAVPGILYCKLKEKSLSLRPRMRLFRPEHLLFLACILVVMITGSLLCEILTGGIASLVGNFTLYSTFVARLNGNGGQALYVILAYALLPAFCEELVFRGILCAEYEKYGVGVSIAASALFFAFLHFSLPLLLSYLFVGAILACALYTTKSFFAPFLLHLCYNIFCLLGQPYLSAFYVNAGSNEIFLFCLISLFLLFSAFALGEARKIYHIYAKNNADSSYTVSYPMKELPSYLAGALRSPATAPCFLLWLVMAIVNLL